MDYRTTNPQNHSGISNANRANILGEIFSPSFQTALGNETPSSEPELDPHLDIEEQQPPIKKCRLSTYEDKLQQSTGIKSKQRSDKVRRQAFIRTNQGETGSNFKSDLVKLASALNLMATNDTGLSHLNIECQK